MSHIIITVESGSDMPKDLALRYGIHVVPMHISFGAQTKDDRTFPVSEICDYYDRTGKIPKTSGCTPEDFRVLFDRLQTENPGASILHIAYSAVTTCSFQSAMMAEEGRSDIICVDTRQVAVGQTAVAVRVAQELEWHPEWSLQEAAQYARKTADRVEMCFVPRNLSFLRAGGRVTNAAAMVGSILNIHPLIELRNGYLVAGKKLRGNFQKLIPKVIQEFVETNHVQRSVLWLESVIGLSKEEQQIAEDTAHRLGFQSVRWVSAGGVITTHGGPGAFAVAGYVSGE